MFLIHINDMAYGIKTGESLSANGVKIRIARCYRTLSKAFLMESGVGQKSKQQNAKYCQGVTLIKDSQSHWEMNKVQKHERMKT